MIFVPQLGIKVKALILEDSQNVLSLGRIIREQGFDYYWQHGKDPVLLKGKKQFDCPPSCDVPFLVNSVQEDQRPDTTRNVNQAQEEVGLQSQQPISPLQPSTTTSDSLVPGGMP